MHNYNYKQSGEKNNSIYRRVQFFAIILCVCLCIMSVGMMIGRLAGRQDGKLRFEKREYYAVCLKVFDDLNSAKAYALSVKSRNGAGYIADDRGYRVLAAVYADRADCESVIKKLNASGQPATLLRVELKSTAIASSELSQKDFDIAMASFFDAQSRLYSLSIELDTFKTDSAKAAAELLKLQSLITPDRLGQDLVSIQLKAALVGLRSALLEIAHSGAQGYTLSAEIKYLQIKLLYDINALLEEIKE